MRPFADIASLKLLVLDVDHVLTDGRTWQTASGVWRRNFSVRDTLAIRALRRSGMLVAVLTSADDSDVRAQLAKLPLDEWTIGCEDKAQALQRLLKVRGLSECNTIFIGYQSMDLALFNMVGLAVTVPRAAAAVRAKAHYITRSEGGEGVVWETGEYLRALSSEIHGPRAVNS